MSPLQQESAERPPVVPQPPSGDELPYDDGQPLETARHRQQMNLLIEPLERYWQDRDDFFVGGNMFFYFSATQSKRNDFRGPDVFVVLGTTRRERKSWVVWEEDGRVPDVVIELTSDSTADEDRGRKKQVYAFLRIPTYVVYDPFSAAFEVFELGAGDQYERVPPPDVDHYSIELTGLSLAVWSGVYTGTEAPWLRWHTPDGEPLPTGDERANAEADRVEAAKTEAALLAAKLAAYEQKFGALDDLG